RHKAAPSPLSCSEVAPHRRITAQLMDMTYSSLVKSGSAREPMGVSTGASAPGNPTRSQILHQHPRVFLRPLQLPPLSAVVLAWSALATAAKTSVVETMPIGLPSLSTTITR